MAIVPEGPLANGDNTTELVIRNIGSKNGDATDVLHAVELRVPSAEVVQKLFDAGVLSPDEPSDEAVKRLFSEQYVTHAKVREVLPEVLQQVFPEGTDHIDNFISEVALQEDPKVVELLAKYLPVITEKLPHLKPVKLLGAGGHGFAIVCWDGREKKQGGQCNKVVKVSFHYTPSSPKTAKIHDKRVRDSETSLALRALKEPEILMDNATVEYFPDISSFGEFDLGDGNSQPFMEMSYAGSKTFDYIMSLLEQAKTSMQPDKVIEILALCIDATAQLVADAHRDIKPANIAIDPRGRIKILDLGFGKKSEEGGAAELTEAGTYMGTHSYIAPEGATLDNKGDGGAKALTKLSDLYSFGLVAAELLNKGQRLIQSQSMMHRLRESSKQNELFDLSFLEEYKAKYPRLVEVLTMILQKDPYDRLPATAGLDRDASLKQQKQKIETGLRNLKDYLLEGNVVGPKTPVFAVNPDSINPNNIDPVFTEDELLDFIKAKASSPAELVQATQKIVHAKSIGVAVVAISLAGFSFLYHFTSGRLEGVNSKVAANAKANPGKEPADTTHPVAAETQVSSIAAVSPSVDTLSPQPESWAYPGTNEFAQARMVASEGGNFTLQIGNDIVFLQDVHSQTLSPAEFQAKLDSRDPSVMKSAWIHMLKFNGMNGSWTTSDIYSYSVQGVSVSSHSARVNLSKYLEEIGGNTDGIDQNAEGMVDIINCGLYEIHVLETGHSVVWSSDPMVPSKSFASPQSCLNYLQNLGKKDNSVADGFERAITHRGLSAPQNLYVFEVDPHRSGQVEDTETSRKMARDVEDRVMKHFGFSEWKRGDTVASNK